MIYKYHVKNITLISSEMPKRLERWFPNVVKLIKEFEKVNNVEVEFWRDECLVRLNFNNFIRAGYQERGGRGGKAYAFVVLETEFSKGRYGLYPEYEKNKEWTNPDPKEVTEFIKSKVQELWEVFCSRIKPEI